MPKFCSMIALYLIRAQLGEGRVGFEEVVGELVGEAFGHLQVQRSLIILTVELVVECLISTLKEGSPQARRLIVAGYWNEG